MATALECIGISFFSFLVIGSMDNMTHSILAMNTIFVVPLAYRMYREIKKCLKPEVEPESKRDWSAILRFVGCTILSIGGIGLLGYHVHTVRYPTFDINVKPKQHRARTRI